MTGLYPPSHGIHVNGISALSPKVATLAESFQAAGEETAAFVAAYVLDSAFGLDQGFDHYDDQMVASASDPNVSSERPGDHVADAALAWLEANGDKPFFAWVHFFDPHDPYEPPAPYREKCDNPYDGEIAFADSQLDRLLDWLNEHGRTERTIVAVVGDHGEAFGDHGEKSHGLFVYNATIHVPLIIAYPPTIPPGTRIRKTVGVVDVAATLLELAGLDNKLVMDGVSLTGHFRASEGADRFIYVESEYPRLGFGWAPLFALTNERWKYIAAPRPELYDRAADPAESNNLIESSPDAAAKMLDELARVIDGMHREAGGTVAAAGSSTQMLESLGYVSGTRDAPAEGLSLRDPKDMVEVYVALLSAKALIHGGSYDEAVKLLESAVKQSPESGELLATLAEAFLKMGRFADAEERYRASLQHQPADAAKLCAMGDALRGQNKLDESIDAYNRALAVSPGYGQAHSRLGLVYASRGDHARAHTHFSRFAELNPASPNAQSNLANVLLALNRPAEAVEKLQNALRIDPGYGPAHQTLWQALQAAGRQAEAFAALRQAVKRLPNDTILVRSLAMALMANAAGDNAKIDESLQLARRLCELDPSPESSEVLAQAQAAAGDFESAIRTAQFALQQAEDSGKSAVAERLRRRLADFQQATPGSP